MNGDLMNVYGRRATNSLSFILSDTGADTQGIENRWWPHTGTYKDRQKSIESNLLAGVLNIKCGVGITEKFSLETM